MDAPDLESDVDICVGNTTDPPIASVPPDVLGYILNFVYQNSDINENKHPNSPIVFSHVCRFWRSIALDNSLWWTRIIVTPPWKLDEVGTFLARSKECPLDLRIFVDINPTTFKPLTRCAPLDNYENLRNLISPHIHRCRTFRLQGCFDKPTQFLIPYLSESFCGVYMPYLEQFIVDERLEIEPKLYQRKLFSSAPLLQDLRIGGSGLRNCILLLNAVTKLHITTAVEGVSSVQLNAVFNACTSLTELALYDNILSPELEESPLSPLFVFPSLLTLQLLAYITTVSEFLLLISSAPKLRRLVLVPLYEHDLILFEQMTPRNNFPSLTSLVLSPIDDVCWEAIALASMCFPAITHLILANGYRDEFKRYFLERTTPLFPCLLDLALNDVNHAFGGVVNDFVIFRRSEKVPLQTVFVDEASMRHLSQYSHLWGDTKLIGHDLIGPLREDLTHCVRNRFRG
ncbi:hypothetical protein M413DRAFT_443295 [Hebeloma cylindrosporum]|uniref:F-box domain-containing protein n=1 Tax=Hebeloma cylindrosporum TaxID=76867 RepID=A0A0C3C5Y6_HEBCY|nr:hypothetical protein M413DRAFT_443295 [Hebeloma cylindrosporum h7]